MSNKSVFELNLHDTANLSNGWIVVRVPGGWIYSYSDYNSVAYDRDMGNQNETNTHSVFVPYTKEVKEERLENLLQNSMPNA